MGCWSVSCGISNIAITSGKGCYILPLIKSDYLYDKYVPATLPILGEYNDYGGMENISHDSNTALIEDYFGISIEEFVEFLVDGEHTYNRQEVQPIRSKIEQNGKLDEAKEIRFMWIDEKVYNFMSKAHDNFEKGHHSLGTPEMLQLLGFVEVIGAEISNFSPERFNKKYQKGDLFVYSDGNVLLSVNNKFIYHLGKSNIGNLKDYTEIPKEALYLKDKCSWEVWKLMSKTMQFSVFESVFGANNLETKYFMETLCKKLGGKDKNPYSDKKLFEHYFDDMESFGDLIAKLKTVRFNMHACSSAWRPHQLYLTPQFGKRKLHDIILKEFVKINKSYIDY